MPVGKHITHREILRKTNDGIIDGSISMGVVLTQDLTDDARRFFIRLGRSHARLEHGVEYSTMHGLKSVSNVGDGARHYDAHCIIDIRELHLAFEMNGYDLLGELS